MVRIGSPRIAPVARFRPLLQVAQGNVCVHSCIDSRKFHLVVSHILFHTNEQGCRQSCFQLASAFCSGHFIGQGKAASKKHWRAHSSRDRPHERAHLLRKNVFLTSVLTQNTIGQDVLDSVQKRTTRQQVAPYNDCVVHTTPVFHLGTEDTYTQ